VAARNERLKKLRPVEIVGIPTLGGFGQVGSITDYFNGDLTVGLASMETGVRAQGQAPQRRSRSLTPLKGARFEMTTGWGGVLQPGSAL